MLISVISPPDCWPWRGFDSQKICACLCPCNGLLELSQPVNTAEPSDSSTRARWTLSVRRMVWVSRGPGPARAYRATVGFRAIPPFGQSVRMTLRRMLCLLPLRNSWNKIRIHPAESSIHPPPWSICLSVNKAFCWMQYIFFDIFHF